MKKSNLTPNLPMTMHRDYFGNCGALYLLHIWGRVNQHCPVAIDIAVHFLTTSSQGFHHNRFRAKVSRYFKHVKLSSVQEQKILTSILGKLSNGEIDEQFMEQLRYALFLDAHKTITCASQNLTSNKSYVVRYAQKIIEIHMQRELVKSNLKP